jgi:uncharacterized protein DUF6527
MKLSSRLTLKKIVQNRSDAEGYLRSPGDAVLIERGTPRWLLLACPCGCGAELPINLDRRAGKAWRLFKHGKSGLSVYPSVWRDTDCGSHFIIWRSNILLFGEREEDLESPSLGEELQTLRGAVLDWMPVRGFVSYADIADKLQVDPWDVLDACRSLARRGSLREGMGKERGHFIRT